MSLSGGQEAFFEGPVHARVLGNVEAGQVRYDNLNAAVPQVLGITRARVMNERWTAFGPTGARTPSAGEGTSRRAAWCRLCAGRGFGASPRSAVTTGPARAGRRVAGCGKENGNIEAGFTSGSLTASITPRGRHQAAPEEGAGEWI